MDKEAARQAWERLHRARNAQQRLVNAKVIHEAEGAWSDFLTASGAIYAKLEKGAKGHPKAEPWFGRVKNERKTDPLLSYVHHARNTDLHGVTNISKRNIDGIGIRGGPGGARMYGLKVTGDGQVIQDARNTGVIVDTVMSLHLTTVHDDLHGDSFDVPTTHLGEPLPDATPQTVSRLALQYLDRIVRQGSEFIK